MHQSDEPRGTGQTRADPPSAAGAAVDGRASTLPLGEPSGPYPIGAAGHSLPLVSAIVPVLNDPRGIETCVNALLRQTYPSDRYEIIVADNGSTDGTRAVVERLRARVGPRLSLVVEDRVRSSYAARNLALRAARGQIVAFTDADCVPAASWLERGVNALAVHGVAGAAGRIAIFYREARPNACEYWDSAARFDQRRYVERHFAATANLFVRADVFGRWGPFRSDLSSGGDREFCARLYSAGERLTYVADALVDHPARATLGSACAKIVRLALAHGPLHDLGVIPSRWECARKVRSWRCPTPRDWNGSLSRWESVKTTALHNLNVWVRVAICLAQGLGSLTRVRASCRGGASPRTGEPPASPHRWSHGS